jgi:hypothetical protein
MIFLGAKRLPPINPIYSLGQSPDVRIKKISTSLKEKWKTLWKTV